MADLIAFAQQEYLLVGLLLVLIALYFRQESKAAGDKISTSEAVSAMNADSAVVVDLRDKKDFSAGHITNAIHLAHSKVSSSLRVLEPHKDKRIILVDKMGQHAPATGKLLAKEGYNVCRLSGGIEEWKAQSLPLVK